MYIHQNLNPYNEDVDDCVIRAIALATGRSWQFIFWDLSVRAALVGDLPNANRVWIPYLQEQGFTKHNLPDTCPVCYTFKQFTKDHRHGIYILGDGQHAVAVVDGNYIDTYDSGKRTVLFYFSKEE